MTYRVNLTGLAVNAPAVPPAAIIDYFPKGGDVTVASFVLSVSGGYR